MLTERIRKWFVRISIVVPVLFICYYVYKYGYPVPYWDQWSLVGFLQKFHNHTLTLGDLWAQHNEHRIFFPKIVMILLASVSGWNIFLELCVSIILACISLFLLFSLVNDTHGKKGNALLKIVISLLVFSTAQYENWLWGWQITIYMSISMTIMAVWSINKWQGQMKGLVIAICAAIIANYSFGCGILVWPTLLFMLILQEKWKLKHIIIWLIVGFVTLASYYYHYHSGSSYYTQITFFIQHPIIFSQYILGYLGASLGHRIYLANLIGLILLIIIIFSILDIWRLDKERLRKLIPWLTFVLFVIMTAFITALGRAVLGIGQALSSRYTTISTLLVISAIVLLYNSVILNLEKKEKASLKDIAFILIVSLSFCVAYITSYEFGVSEMKSIHMRVRNASVYLNDPDNASDKNLKALYPVTETLIHRIKVLKELGYKFDTEN